MEPENIILATAVAAAIALILWRAHSVNVANEPIAGATLNNPSELSDAYEAQLSNGPSYYVASAPYYFAPPVSNVMPQSSAARTIPFTDDGGCGCS